MKTQKSMRLSDLTSNQLEELTESLGMTQTDVMQLAIERLYQSNQLNADEDVIRAINMCPRGNHPSEAEQRQKVLRVLGEIALPPKGHRCPMCNNPGELYCLDVAIKRVRGLSI